MKKELKVIGKSARKLDGKQRATGKAVYGHDIQLPKMLHGSILRTKHPHAEIISIDTSKALALGGVECIITAEDVDVNNISYKRDHPILKNKANCERDEIAAVAARTKEIADKAIELIEVEYKVLDGIYDPVEALKEDASRINEFGKGDEQFGNKNIADSFHYEHGDIEQQKAKSKIIIKKRYELPRVTHACMATSNITAEFNELDGRLTLWSSTQVPFLYQRDIAHALKMEPSNIRIIQPIIGGGFGSKLDMHPFEPICALLAMKSGKPVQILYSREEEFILSPTRQPMIIELTTGADENGKFTFREVDIIKDNGAYTSWGATTPFVMMQTYSSLYQIPACKFDSLAVYTNNPFAGSFRGYGNPQATFSLENNIDLMAEALEMDKAEIRLLNVNYKDEVTGQGLHYKTCGAKAALETVIEKSKYHKIINEANKGRYKRGVGLASMLHVGGGAKIYRSDGCGTTLKLDDYGYLTIVTGSNEIGQGSETVLAMIAMEELGISRDKIKVINTDTDVKPWDVGVHASRTSFVAGNSLLGAIGLLKEMLISKAAELLNVDVDDWVYENGMMRFNKHEIKIDKVVREIHFGTPHQLCTVNYFMSHQVDSRIRSLRVMFLGIMHLLLRPLRLKWIQRQGKLMY